MFCFKIIMNTSCFSQTLSTCNSSPSFQMWSYLLRSVTHKMKSHLSYSQHIILSQCFSHVHWYFISFKTSKTIQVNPQRQDSSFWGTKRRSFPVWASCEKGLALSPTHGHCDQPGESEQVTHTTLTRPLFLTFRGGKGKTKKEQLQDLKEVLTNITHLSA